MRHFRPWWLVILVNTAGGLIPALLAFAFNPGAGPRFLWDHLRFGCIYSYIIGTMAFVVLGYLAPRFGRMPRLPGALAYLLTFVGLALTGSALANVVFLALGWTSPASFWEEFRYGLRIALVITIILGAAVTVIEGLSYRLQATALELKTRQLEEERARKLVTEARLSSLEARIHPHFLFNTLNSISELIREDPGRAERTTERLASLLRYSLDMGSRPLVPLRQELRVVEDYVEIERTRFGDRLRWVLDVPAELGELDVPPLSLQTLVENSIKHAVSKSRQGGEVRVVARLAHERLLLEVSDDGPGFDAGALKKGHGLENLQERLTALFEGSGKLDIARRDGRTVVSVSVPQKKVLV
jgi:sensor histidine kinase YesM